MVHSSILSFSKRMSGSGFLAGFMFGNVNAEGELEDDVLDKVHVCVCVRESVCE